MLFRSMKAICLRNYLSESRPVTAEENAARTRDHLIFKAQVPRLRANVPWGSAMRVHVGPVMLHGTRKAGVRSGRFEILIYPLNNRRVWVR